MLRKTLAWLALLGLGCALPAAAQDASRTRRLLPLPDPTDGVTFDVAWDADAFDNRHGGIRTGRAGDSLLHATAALDTAALGGWRGGTFTLGVETIASSHPSARAGDLQVLSNIDAPSGFQPSRFTYTQRFAGHARIRAGIMDVNDWFDHVDVAELFVNSSFGITPSIASNVAAPTYPDAGWGLMSRFGRRDRPWRIGVFQGDPQHRSTALRRGTFAIAEHGWRQAARGRRIQIGGWYRNVPATAERPRRDGGAYANLEQRVRPHARLFVQLGASPPRASVVPVHIGAGLVLSDLAPAIPELGLAFTRVRIRGHRAETSVEGTFTIAAAGGALVLQPDVQYIFHPAGIHPNALVIGLRLHAQWY